jgi:D-xylose transport system permease protein
MTEIVSNHETSNPQLADAQPGMRSEITEPPKLRIGPAFAALEIDTRLLGMLAALAVMWVTFHVVSDGLFLTPRNLWNLSVQSAAVAILATGMVLVIVARHIDLSVGSVVVFVAMFMALAQTEWLPNTLGWGLGQPQTWVVALAAGLILGALVGAVHGFVVAYVGVPSFIVTLGGLLIWRAVAFELADGRTIAPLDSRFQLIGGGPNGSLGEFRTWLVAAIASVVIILGLLARRRRRVRHGFPLRPAWADATLGLLGCGAVVGAAWVANSYMWPPALAQRHAIERGIDAPPGGLQIPTGIAIPVLIAIGVAVVMRHLATRRRFGRYIYAIGGNPEAAELAGINTRWTVMKAFIAMGTLAALAAAVISARLNAAAIGLGTGLELQVIAAAVIGGTSFSGGVGTIAGAVIGAVLMQSLQSGMVLMKVGTATQDIVIGLVLVSAVAFDTILARRRR